MSNPAGTGPTESASGDCPASNSQQREDQSGANLYMNLEQYPNPFEDQFVLMVNAREIETVDIRVNNALGQEVQFLPKQLSNQPLRMGLDWPSGIYTVSVKGRSIIQTLKVVKR